jgi:hypothetical protein
MGQGAQPRVADCRRGLAPGSGSAFDLETRCRGPVEFDPVASRVSSGPTAHVPGEAERGVVARLSSPRHEGSPRPRRPQAGREVRSDGPIGRPPLPELSGHRLAAQAQRSRANPLTIEVPGGKQPPVPLGDDFDVDTVGHLDRGLVVDRVRRRRYPRSPLLCDGRAVRVRQDTALSSVKRPARQPSG